MFRQFLFWLLPKRKKNITYGLRSGGALEHIPDKRDYLVSGTTINSPVLPSSFSLRGNGLTRVEDQGEYNSCVAHAISTAIETMAVNSGWSNYFELSRMHLYNEGRKISGTYPENQGMYTRDAWKAVQKPEIGITIEKLFPYSRENFNVALPSNGASIFRNWYPKFNYYWIDGTIQSEKEALIKDAIFNKRVPVVFATPIPASFLNAKSKEVYSPTTNENIQFYHAMLVTGWDDSRGCFEVMNSWGPVWGREGFIDIEKKWLLSNGYNWSYPEKRRE